MIVKLVSVNAFLKNAPLISPMIHQSVNVYAGNMKFVPQIDNGLGMNGTFYHKKKIFKYNFNNFILVNVWDPLKLVQEKSVNILKNGIAIFVIVNAHSDKNVLKIKNGITFNGIFNKFTYIFFLK